MKITVLPLIFNKVLDILTEAIQLMKKYNSNSKKIKNVSIFRQMIFCVENPKDNTKKPVTNKKFSEVI